MDTITYYIHIPSINLRDMTHWQPFQGNVGVPQTNPAKSYSIFMRKNINNMCVYFV